jgi:hypothetical protein
MNAPQVEIAPAARTYNAPAPTTGSGATHT